MCSAAPKHFEICSGNTLAGAAFFCRAITAVTGYDNLGHQLTSGNPTAPTAAARRPHNAGDLSS